MTTTSAKGSYIDYAAFGLEADDLRSLAALSDIWARALDVAAGRFGNDGTLAEFVSFSARLTERIDDLSWQSAWMHAWHRLNGEGFTLVDMFSFFNHAMACCEAEVLGLEGPVSRLQLRLFGIFRRSVVAAVSCAIELGEQMSSIDAGLPGEHAAIRRLKELAAEGRSVALLSVSLTNPRAYSHLSRSELQYVPGLLTKKLVSLLRPQDIVFGGREGEWLLLLPDVKSMAQPALAANHLRHGFEEPVMLLSGRGLMLDVAIGAAMLPDHGSEAADIVRAARLARASLRDAGDSFAMFEESLQQAWQYRYQLSESLKEALRQEKLEFYLQPQVDSVSGVCFGAELLVRWNLAAGNSVPPPLIIEMIEENGWRGQFTEWLIRSALRLGGVLQAAGIDIHLSLNLTAGDMQDDDLPELVAQCLETWRVPGGKFTFELIESAMLGNRERTLSIMHRLREQGIELALDDFGTGYSSLSYLATLPLNEIKIDRSFVVGIFESVDNLRIVRTIIDLTRDLGLRILAEGVEDVAQRDQLLALGCTNIQGYLYGRPMPVDDFIAWYRARQA